MLTLPEFELVMPKTVDEAIDALRAPGARMIAGGTDLLPNLKHRLESPSTLVSLQRLDSLRRVEEFELDGVGGLRIGAMCTLSMIASDSNILDAFPSLATAAESVAAPQIRNVATLGGNINLDTRCRYINQTAFWREALGGCLKAETCDASKVCHVVPSGKRCVAAMSSDTVPVLVSLGATLVLQGPSGQRTVACDAYFRGDGTQHTVREEGELLTHVFVPRPAGARRSTYVKWRVRNSIDFPLVSIALCFEGDETIESASVVVGVLGATPRGVDMSTFVGRRFDDELLAEEIADAVHRRSKPLPNVPYEPGHRRRLIRVLTRRAVRAIAH